MNDKQLRLANYEAPPAPLPFPNEDCGPEAMRLSESATRVYGAIETMSRRIDDLARELNCFGVFEGDDDGPRAA